MLFRPPSPPSPRAADMGQVAGELVTESHGSCSEVVTGNQSQVPCPRCAYDVAGSMPLWRVSCPLEGRCPECGLDFHWRDLLNPQLRVPAWSFEHATASYIQHWTQTSLVSLRPRRLWASIRLESTQRTGRLMVMVLLALLATHLIIVASSLMTIAVCPGLRYLLSWNPATVTTVPLLASRSSHHALGVLLWPYGWSQHPPTCVNPLQPILLLWAILSPLPYLIILTTLKSVRVSPRHLVRGVAYLMPRMLCLMIGFTLLTGVYIWSWSNSYVPLMTAYHYLSFVDWLLVPICGCWIGSWWTAFTREYLRLPHAGFVAGMLQLIAGLAAVAAVIYFPGGDMIEPVARVLTLWNDVFHWW